MLAPPRKVIFLDVDGVMNNAATVTDHQRGFVTWLDPNNVAVLNHVVSASGAAVVVSSSWRWSMPFAELRAAFAAAGCSAAIVDVTPDIDGPRRGREIAAWLAAQPEPPARYVILDDDFDMPEHPGRLVKIDRVVGLSVADVPLILACLAD